jgi:tetratricopeptide (TPR) repeat protein
MTVRGFFLILLSVALCCAVNAAEPSEELAPAPATNEYSAEALKAYLQKQERSNLLLQDKLHTLQSSLQENREESEAAARRSSESLAARLKIIEQTLTMQREREMEVMQKSNRFLLTVAGVFGCVGLFAMMFTAWFLLRAMNRLGEVAAAMPPSFPTHFALEEGTTHVAALPPESNRLLGAIDRLEKRIHQLEHTPHSVTIGPGEHQTNGGSESDPMELVAPGSGGRLEGKERFTVVVAKGESLLNLDQADKALACFDEALGLNPGHAETLVKKGTALERLKRWEEALTSYDQAIAADNSLTLAYLYKGGVYNQLEKFTEALECYEQALRTQQKQPAAVS